MPPLHLHVISHTHWDREWYLSHERFRLRLVDLIDRLLDILDANAEFRVFHLDGQTIVLEDYLELRPYQRTRLERHIRAGRILVGPWYLQNDHFLTHGESTVRNMLLGHRICREWDVAPMPTGYSPDLFGNISQFPQILRGFGLESAVYGRGYQGPDGHTEFLWRSPDGSTVLAIFLAQWYNNAQRFPADGERAVAMVRELLAGQEGRAQTPHRLLMNGVDHLEAQENLPDILAEINALKPGFTIRQSTLPEYCAAVREALPDPPVHTGELREGDEGSVLTGTASARMPVKLLNHACEQELLRWTEPFSLLARLNGCAYDFESGISYAWKWLIQCHPHDTICGCSIDEVHRQQVSRLTRVRDVAEELTGRALYHLTASALTEPQEGLHSRVAFFNASGTPRAGVAETTWNTLEGEDIADLKLVSANGDALPFAVLETTPLMVRRLNPKRLPKLLPIWRHRVLVQAPEMPATGFAVASLVRHKGDAAARAHAPEQTLRLENGMLEVEIADNGTLAVRLAGTDVHFANLLQFEDTADTGNEYIYMQPPGDVALRGTHFRASARIMHRSALATIAEIVHTGPVPACYDHGEKERSGSAELELRTTLTLRHGESFLRVRTAFVNRHEDHRLRVLFPTGLTTDTALADAPFDTIVRPFDMKTPNRNNTHPMQSFAAVFGAEGRGFALLTRGIPEYEVLAGDSTIALTLLRCVDILGDLPPQFWNRDLFLEDYTPDAQCLGAHAFEYAIAPIAGPADAAALRNLADAYLAEPRTYQVPADAPAWEGKRYGAPAFFEYFEDEASALPAPPLLARPARSLVRLDNPRVSLSCVKWPEFPGMEAAACVVVRVVNDADSPQKVRLTTGAPLSEAVRVNLAERNAEALAVSGDACTVTLRPREIATVRLEFAR